MGTQQGQFVVGSRSSTGRRSTDLWRSGIAADEQHTDLTARGDPSANRSGPVPGASRPGAVRSSSDRGWQPSALVRFGWTLRAAGLRVAPAEVRAYCQAVLHLDPADAVDLYWIGRACLVKDPAGIPIYDRLFWSVFVEPRV